MRPKTFCALFAVCTACMSPEATGLAPSPDADTTVKVDLFHRPLPELPLPNDLATRGDVRSATGRRINASMIAPTHLEMRVRRLLDTLDGWGVFQPIGIPFTGPLDVQSILDGHRDTNYDPSNDVVYLINVDPDSPRLGELTHLDLGNGNYPVVGEERDAYWKHDPGENDLSLIYDDTYEDTNDNGVLDPGEDIDADGVLDLTNFLPGFDHTITDIAARTDALMTFYERETHTLIARPMVPLDERTTYAIVVTRRLRDIDGNAVGSPYPFINHTSQTMALEPLLDVLPTGLTLDDIAFAFTFTTQTVQQSMIAVRSGLYGRGIQGHIGRTFPAQLDSLLPLRENVSNVFVMHGETWAAAQAAIIEEFNSGDPNSEQFRIATEVSSYIDYFVIGSYLSPQLFQREDAAGNWLPLDEQSWPQDLDRVAAPTRAERVFFTLSVPRKESSVRGGGAMAPIVFQGHGYTSNRFEGMQLAGFFAKYGLATFAIDGPSHGIGLNDLERVLANSVISNEGLPRLTDALLSDRTHNQDNDPLNTRDTGADYWTSYLFHTRDMVRQNTLDYMQAIRIIRSFDGQRTWKFDVNGDGQNELAGDFDGDGVVDIGSQSTMNMLGGSLGGMMSMMVGSLEPEITAIAPIAGGGGYTDMGARTVQGGAVEGFILRSMCPIYTGSTDALSGRMKIETIIPDLNDVAEVEIANIDGVSPGDTLVVHNLKTGERGCGYVDNDGSVRASVASDIGDPTRIELYAGEALELGDIDCATIWGAEPYRVIDTFEENGSFQFDDEGMAKQFRRGDPLVALAEGLALRRGHPDFRRFFGLGQLVLDSGDPAAFARHLWKEPLVYPRLGTIRDGLSSSTDSDHQTGTHALIITTVGDMSVPVASGIAYGRAAGIIDYLNDDPRYGKPINQVLIDEYVAEGVHNINRFTDSSGAGVHLDPENFSEGTDTWGTEIPRLSPPLRIGIDDTDALGGKSAKLFPFPRPSGQHGFYPPGNLTDRVRRDCRNACAMPGTCGCDTLTTFDIGNFMFNMAGRYLGSGGQEISVDLCQSRNDCVDVAPLPTPRDPTALQ